MDDLNSSLERIRDFVRTRFLARTATQAFDDDTPLFSSGIVDSFGVLELIAFLESAFGVEVDTSRHELHEFDTVRKSADLVASLLRRS